MAERLTRVRLETKPGDKGNREAVAAQIYWRALFGAAFRRDKDGDGLNALLNYGYAIIRTAMSKAVLATGLHPSFGIHHSHPQNAFCLVDDLIEPYRPLVDQAVKRLDEKGVRVLDQKSKSLLARLVIADTTSADAMSPLAQHKIQLCRAILEAIESAKSPALPFPEIFTPIELEGLVAGC